LITNRALSIIALFVLSASFLTGQFPQVETRCIWVLRNSLYTPGGIDSVLTYAAQQNFDKVFIQIRSRGDALYNSRLVGKNENILPGFDPLAYAIELGHEFDLEIHAWMNTYLLWSGPRRPADPDHLLNRHPEWTEANDYGKMDWRIDASKPPSPNWEGIFLSPGNPAVNAYLAGIIREVYENYDVDGIQLDYIRYQDDFYGYSPESRKAFKAVYDIDPLDIARGIISTRFGWEPAFVDSIKNAWQNFRQDNITNLLRILRSEIDASSRPVQLSAAVKPNLTTAAQRWSQDWQKWVQEGLVDFVVPMNYYKEIVLFTRDIMLMKEAFQPDLREKIIMGIATYNQDAAAAADKVMITRLNGFTGVSIFSYDAHKNNLEWLSPLLEAMVDESP